MFSLIKSIPLICELSMKIFFQRSINARAAPAARFPIIWIKVMQPKASEIIELRENRAMVRQSYKKVEFRKDAFIGRLRYVKTELQEDID